MTQSRWFQADEDIWNAAISVAIDVREALVQSLVKTPAEAKEVTTIYDKSGRPKDILAADKQAEDQCKRLLYDHFSHSDLDILGEETLWKDKGLDLSGRRTLVALLDMLDGSDLFERDLSNWCSAMVFFQPEPRPPRIVCALVHDALGRIFFANTRGAFLILPRPVEHSDEPNVLATEPPLGAIAYNRAAYEHSAPVPLKGPEYVETRDASVCFYAQKTSHFTTIPAAFQNWTQETVRERSAGQRDPRLRIYTLAGNPMMAKLANGEGIHAVFEHIGQYPHDAVAGAYIALKSGASVVDANGEEILGEHLAATLLKPSGAQLKYVVAATPVLASQIAACI